MDNYTEITKYVNVLEELIREASDYESLQEFQNEVLKISLSNIGVKSTEVKEAVNHPDHYNSHPSGVECIDIIRHMNLNCGSAIKYLWRNGLKDGNPSIQELRKAAWYINDEIVRLENQKDAT